VVVRSSAAEPTRAGRPSSSKKVPTKPQVKVSVAQTGKGSRVVARDAAAGGWSWRSVRSHVSVLLALLLAATVLQYHAATFSNPSMTTYGPALVVSAVLLLASVLAVYAWPTRTERWRTVVWVYVLSAGFGAVAFLLFKGRAGLFAALLSGLLVLLLRVNENGRRWWAAWRSKRI